MSDIDERSDAERAYFESGGEKTDGLTEGSAAAAPDTAAEAKPEAEAAKEPDPKASASETKAEPTTKAGDPDPAADDTAADLAADDPKRPPPQRVSYHKFRRTEDRARAAERELTEMREKFARGDERLRLLSEALTVAPPKEGAGAEEDKAPDPEQDIFAFVRWQSRQMERLSNELKGTRGEIGQTRETIQQRDAADELRTTYQRDAVAFAQKTPDFVQAYNHMLDTRAQMLEDQGYGAEDIKVILANEERGLVQRAVQANKSPAEMIYGIAQRFGYRKAVAAADAAGANGAAAVNGNGAVPAAKDAATAKPSVSDEIARIKAGQEAGKTLSGAGGAATELTVEALALMPEKEFEALLAKKPDLVASLMGRPN